MKNFVRLTNELYGARHAGYCFDLTAPRECDNDLMTRLVADIGWNYVDGMFDSFCDFDGDLYRDDNGDLYAVMFYNERPFCWQKVKKQ